MKTVRRWAVLGLALLLAVSMTACGLPTPGFVDYDVSGYIKALLDSSYHDDSEKLMDITNVTEEQARENNITTVENAAVTFCNAYELSLSESQMEVLKQIMKRAFALTRYTVKKERKVEGGYYLEVEVASITNFEGRGQEIEEMKRQAQQAATAANTTQPADLQSEDSNGDGGEDSDPEPTPVPPKPSSGSVDANELFIEKVLDFCERELANIMYDPESRSIPLDIRQTEEGELQLDLNQIETVDQTVIRIAK